MKFHHKELRPDPALGQAFLTGVEKCLDTQEQRLPLPRPRSGNESGLADG